MPNAVAGGAPGALGTAWEVLPKGTGSGTAVVICPGGGYQTVVMDREGYSVAKWLNTWACRTSC